MYNWQYTHNIGIQMKQKDLTEAFMLILTLKKLFFFVFRPPYKKYFSVVRVNNQLRISPDVNGSRHILFSKLYKLRYKVWLYIKEDYLEPIWQQ